MPLRRKTGKPRRRYARRRVMKISRQPRQQSQVFTETFKCNTISAPSPTCPGVLSDGTIRIQPGTQFTAGKFMVRLTDIPQVQNQANLYNMQKITGATVILIPKFSNSDPNSGQYNLSIPTAAWENARITQAINDTSNDLTTPTSELQVLENNGVKIHALTRPMKIKFKPKAALDQLEPVQAGSIPVQPKFRQWLGFGQDDGVFEPQEAPYHVGVDWVVSCDNTSTTEFLDVADVYVKISFVCKDPR